MVTAKLLTEKINKTFISSESGTKKFKISEFYILSALILIEFGLLI
jgi:hypothetical protein